MNNPIPKKLGKYEVIKEIGRGSMGIIYLGHDPFIDRAVAIKVAFPENLNNLESGERYKRMFFNEAFTAGQLTHPNIINIYDAGVDGETCYIVMEYVAGGATLKPYCKPESLLPLEKVVEIIFKCAKALDYAHRQGVIHRDIKPGNILLTEDQDVKLGDFGIAHMTRFDATGTLPMGMVGSPMYMSPEQVSEDYITHQTDLFSLGVIMYELLTGKHPFIADNFSRLVMRILNEAPVPLSTVRSDVPTSLEAIMYKALHKDKAERYNMGNDLASDLSKAFSQLSQPERNISEQEKFDRVKALDFFRGFPDPEIWEIVRASSWQEYMRGDAIIAEGDLDDSFFIIVRGRAKVSKSGRALTSLLPGDCFGEMGYLARTKRTATVRAKEECAIMKINSSVISQVSLNCQVRFLKVFLRTLIERLTVTNEKVMHEG